MSRIGFKPIALPEGVSYVKEANVITVKGPKGEVSVHIPSDVSVEEKDGALHVRPLEEGDKQGSADHGTTAANLHNAVKGVTEGWKKELEINGVGFRCEKQGKDVIMNLGYSHKVVVSDTDDCKLEVPSPNKIIVVGIDKQKVGQRASEIRSKRPPEPYKGKGIKYVDEYIRRKEGKAGKGKK